jgi:hypothetical protein
MVSGGSNLKDIDGAEKRRRRRKGAKGSGRHVGTKGNNLGIGSSNEPGLRGPGTPSRANLPVGSRAEFADRDSKRSGRRLRGGTERPTGGGMGSTFDLGLGGGGGLDAKPQRAVRLGGKPVGTHQEFGDPILGPPANRSPE